MMALGRHTYALVLGLILGLALAVPHAAYSLGKEADAMCAPVIQKCGCGRVPGAFGCKAGKNMFMCECSDMTSGYKTTGKCVAANTCRAEATTGKDGFGLDQVSKILGDLFNQLMSQGQGQQDGAEPPTNASTTSGCSQTYTVTVPTTDPCAIYIPPVSESILDSTGSALSDLLNVGSGEQADGANTNENDVNTPSASELIKGLAVDTKNDSDPKSVAKPAAVAQQTTKETAPVYTAPVHPASGLQGDIKVLESGGTVIAGKRDQSGNTEVAGFYGGTAFGGQSTGVVASICRARPWASNVLAYVLPANFFDGLCIARGYQVGSGVATDAPPATVSVTRGSARPIQETPVKTPNNQGQATAAEPPKVRIWSVPETVPLGSRASIFWTSQGAENCQVTSSDGNFSQTSLQGGASTVALVSDTTFTIACMGAGGVSATDSVTVPLAI